jgi:3-hydroxybutyryl-CoA dehydrogenase
MALPKVTVVGAGRMGVGIAQAVALAGGEIELLDVKERTATERDSALETAKNGVERGLELLASVGLRGDAALVSYSGPDRLSEARVVFEAVPETREAKDAVYALLGDCLPQGALVGSTTSTFAVDDLAGLLDEPERFMNTHWLNPAPVMPIVEVMPGGATDEDAFGAMTAHLRALGKIPVRCSASAGYIVPRIQALAMNEAARLVEEGVADAETVDLACRLGFGVRFATMGLLEFVDWGGADILLYASEYLTGALGSDRYEAPAIVAEKVQDGTRFRDQIESSDAYRQETLARLVALLDHLGLGRATSG